MAELFTTNLFNDANLVSYYRFEANSNDSKGSNNGSDTSISYATGKFGNGSFGNGSSSRINISGTGLNIASPLTVNTWVYVDSTGSGTDRQVYCSDPNNTVGLLYNYTASQFHFLASTSVTGGIDVTQTGTTSKDVWHMVTWQYDGATLKGYVDNIEVATTVATGTLNSYDPNAWDFFDYSTSANFFKGGVDDLAFFSKSLASNERSTLYLPGGGNLTAFEI